MTFPFAIFPRGPREVDVIWDAANMGASCVLSNSNYDIVGANTQCARAIKGVSALQKGYFEIVISVAVANTARIGSINHSTYSNYGTSTSQACGVRPEATSFLNNGTSLGSATDLGGAFANNDVYMFAIDGPGGKLWTGKAGTWHNSGNPAAGTNSQFTGLTGTHYPGVSFIGATEKYRIRGNTSNITYSPPSGFTVLGAL